MKKLVFTISITLVILNGFSQSLDGFYLGLEEYTYLDSNGIESNKARGYNLFNITAYKISNDSVFVDKLTIAVKGNDTIYAGSDDYKSNYRRGIYTISDSIILITTWPSNCDFCMNNLVNDSLNISNDIQIIKAVKVENDLLIKGFIYQKKNYNVTLLSEGDMLKENEVKIDTK